MSGEDDWCREVIDWFFSLTDDERTLVLLELEMSQTDPASPFNRPTSQE
jgi:hypothetical protein